MNPLPFLIHNWSLVLIAVVSGGMLLWPTISRGARGGLTPNGAVQLINREKAVVVDVCEAEEFAAGHVAGARNIPLNQLEKRLKDAYAAKGNPDDHTLYLKADNDIEYSAVLSAIDAARNAGVRRIGTITELPKGARVTRQ